MAYQSQLVVRSSDARGTEVIDRVKELAGVQDKTYSEMALELLAVGLDGGAAVAEADLEPPAEPAPEDPAEPPPEEAAAAKPAPTEDTTGAPAADAPDIPDGSSVEDVAVLCAETYDASGIDVASQVLAQFFVTCGPAEGGKIKDELQGRLEDDDYEDLFEALRDTDEYRDYRKRVIFGS